MMRNNQERNCVNTNVDIHTGHVKDREPLVPEVVETTTNINTSEIEDMEEINAISELISRDVESARRSDIRENIYRIRAINNHESFIDGLIRPIIKPMKKMFKHTFCCMIINRKKKNKRILKSVRI